MTYELNPHRHVKIWLSKKPDVFLNQENQLRLVRMRVKNPDDTIRLIYARELLSEKALAELMHFCNKHNIVPVSIEDQILPFCLNNEEKNLAALYQQEIKALHDGGNLAAASDMLRWLKPIYSLGIYSDFDVTVNTKELPQTIPVEAPILLNLGSVKIPISGLPRQNDLEAIFLNNDTIAVAGDDAITQQKISEIQQYIYNAYQNTAAYIDVDRKLSGDMSDYVAQQLGVASGLLTAFNYISVDVKSKLNQQLFNGLGLDNPNPIRLRKKLLETKKAGTMVFCRDQLSLMGVVNASEMDDETVKKLYFDFLKANYPYELEPDEMIKVEAESQFKLLYNATVIQTSGPGGLMMSLFGVAALPANKMDEKIKPYSLLNYGLDKAFGSLNSAGSFHVLREDFLARTTGAVCDHSWVEAGELEVVLREEKLTRAAINIQRVFRGHQGRKIASEKRLRKPDDFAITEPTPAVGAQSFVLEKSLKDKPVIAEIGLALALTGGIDGVGLVTHGFFSTPLSDSTNKPAPFSRLTTAPAHH